MRDEIEAWVAAHHGGEGARPGDYRTDPAVNWSRLRLMDVSPLHFCHGSGGPDTPARTLGTYVHAMLLEPDAVDARYAVYDGGGRRGSKAYEAFAAEHPGKCIWSTAVKADQQALYAAQAMERAALAHPVASVLLSHGYGEQAMYWSEIIDGYDVACKGLADWVIMYPTAEQAEYGDLVLMDLKTTRDIRSIANTTARLGYHGQLAHYAAGLQHLHGRRPTVYVLWLESSPPYDVVVTRVPPSVLEAGDRWRRRLLSRVVECERAGHWPGISDGVTELGLPGWAPGNDVDDDFTFEEET